MHTLMSSSYRHPLLEKFISLESLFGKQSHILCRAVSHSSDSTHGAKCIRRIKRFFKLQWHAVSVELFACHGTNDQREQASTMLHWALTLA
jgi:hypothetical protein